VLLTVDLTRLGIRPGDLVLDAGCGEGRHCFGALERGARVVGVDLDRDALRKASGALRFRAHELGRLGGTLQADAFRLPFADARFDRVICSEVMEHVHDYRAAARELARVVRPGGTVAVTIPTATSEHLYLRLGDDYFESPGGHIRIFRPRELARGLAAAGLRTTGVGFAHAFHTPYWALRSVVGLPRADANPLVRAYRAFLIRATTSRALGCVEKLLDRVCPKSLVLYAARPAAPA
jgi:SAM-dependent methyltransferase